MRNGNDLQLGFASAPTDAITNQSATMTKALRQSSKNIKWRAQVPENGTRAFSMGH